MKSTAAISRSAVITYLACKCAIAAPINLCHCRVLSTAFRYVALFAILYKFPARLSQKDNGKKLKRCNKIILSRMKFSGHVGHATIFIRKLTAACGFVVGLRFGLDLVSGWLVVIDMHLYYFRCHCTVPFLLAVLVLL